MKCAAVLNDVFVCFAVVLSEVIQAFTVPENAARMEEARESACNDMGKMLQLVLPVATQIQQEVIKAYGFNNEGEGEIFHTCFHLSSAFPSETHVSVNVSIKLTQAAPNRIFS